MGLFIEIISRYKRFNTNLIIYCLKKKKYLETNEIVAKAKVKNSRKVYKQ